MSPLRILSIALALPLLAGCPTPASKEPTLSLSVAVSSSYPASCPILIAAERDLFREKGVKVTIKPAASGVQALQMALSGEAELATVSDVHFAQNVLDGKPVATVAALARYGGETELVLLGQDNQPAEKAIRGKRIGVTMRSAGHYALAIILSRLGMAESDITLVNLPPQAMADALREGRIDGAVTWEPFLSRILEALADKPHTRLGTGNLALGHWIIAGRQQFIREANPAIEAALRAMDDAIPLCLGEDSAGRQFMIDKGLISADEARRAWNRFRFDVTLDQGLILALEDQAAWGLRRGMGGTNAKPNFLRHLESGPMRKALPSSVTVIE